jgi:hypothetical protein
MPAPACTSKASAVRSADAARASQAGGAADMAVLRLLI